MTITCADCGRTQTIPPLPPGASAACGRCDRELSHRSRAGLDIALLCNATVFFLLAPAIFLPLMDSTIQHLVFQESRLVSSVAVIYSEVWFPFAFGFLFFAFLFPAFRCVLLIVVLGSLRLDRPVAQAGRLFRWSEELRVWCMTEVVVIAGVITYYRASISATVEVRIGAWCYLGVALFSFLADRALDRRAIWNAILRDPSTLPLGQHFASCGICEMAASARLAGDPCPRCGHTLDANITRRWAPALVAMAAALPLLLPAFDYSVIVNDRLTGVWEHTVIGTVELLADSGYWQISIVLFLAGVLLPILQIAATIWVLISVRFPTQRGLVLRTRVYRLLHRLARWPMVMPFIAATAAPIVDFRGIDDIETGVGATPLFLLIALNILALRLFEPRLMWKAAGESK